MFVLRGETTWTFGKGTTTALTHAARVNEPDYSMVNQVLLELKDHIERHDFIR